jgi:ABC-type Fe3+-siderophore transport system permease subunit
MKKRRIRRALKRSLFVASVIPAFAGILYLVALAPAPIAFGAILGLISFPFFLYFAR